MPRSSMLLPQANTTIPAFTSVPFTQGWVALSTIKRITSD